MSKKAIKTLLDSFVLSPVKAAIDDRLVRLRGNVPDFGWQRIYGGHIVAQAMIAASSTAPDDRPIHSLHCAFVRPGDPKKPVLYEIDLLRDGTSFSARQLTARQDGAAIFSLIASFQKDEKGLEHGAEMPDIACPDDLPSVATLVEKYNDHLPENVRNYWQRERPIEIRPVDITHLFSNNKAEPVQHVWFRASSKLPDDQLLHKSVLAYATDMTLLDTPLRAHGLTYFVPELQMASLDHAIWFHKASNFENWHLYVQDSPASSGGRGLARGMIFRQDGTLIASVAQEGLMRLRKTPKI